MDEADAAAAVAHTTAQGWQSDARYAEMLVRSRIAQGHGPIRIEAELELAGVPADQIEAALQGADVDWSVLASEVHNRRFDGPPRSAAERARRYRFLQGRGFDASHISAALKGQPDE